MALMSPYIVIIIATFIEPGARSIRLRSYGSAVELKLAGLAEVAELLGVSRRTASRYTTRPDFPAPISRLRSGPIWLEKDVRAWARGSPVQRGRPPKVPRRRQA